MQKYNKFIIAFIGAVITGIGAFTGLDLAATGITVAGVVAVVTPLLTAIGVVWAPNKEKPAVKA